MNAAIALVQETTPVLVAFFNRIGQKTNPDGTIKTICIQICEILYIRGYDLSSLNYDGHPPQNFRIS